MAPGLPTPERFAPFLLSQDVTGLNHARTSELGRLSTREGGLPRWANLTLVLVSDQFGVKGIPLERPHHRRGDPSTVETARLWADQFTL